MTNATLQDLTGRRLGRFLIRDCLGAGGMGVVYRAHDERLEREVALKVLPTGLLADRTARERFRNEARTLSRFNHPNIETIHDFDTQDSIDFLVMELIPGESLDQRLVSGPLAEADVRRLGVQIAEALAAAHERGVIHRDLKPANLRVTPEGRLKVLDFGIAILLQPQLDVAATLSTLDISSAELEQALTASLGAPQLAGTLPYMAPEVLKGSPADARSDIYSTGVVLYELCCGRRPFTQVLVPDLIHAILHTPPPLPMRIGKTSAEFQRVVLKALEKDPARRHQWARELLEDLQHPPTARRRSGAIDSIAILPFENVSADPETEYISEGITEHLIRSISELPRLKKVTARGSVYRYKSRQVSPQQVGQELGVRAVLTGRVIHHADSITIYTELADTADGRHLWGEKYERHVESVDQIDQEIAEDISEKLRAKLEPKAKRSVRLTVSPEAYRLYLKARFYWNKRPAAGMIQKSIELFERATETDPKFALAYAGLADCYNTMGAWESSAMAPQLAFPQAKAAALRALRLDESLAEAHTALAYSALHYDWDWPASESGFQRALQLNPKYVHAHHWYAHYLVAVGRYDEAFAESQRIIELDPLDLIINVHLAWHHCMAHEFEPAAAAVQKTLEMEPNFHWGYFFLGWAYEQLGRESLAIEALQKSTSLAGGSTVMKAALGHAYALAGDRASAEAVIDELLGLGQTRYVSRYEIGVIYAALGDMERALMLLEGALEERSGWLPYLNAEPRLKQLHGDSRFQRLLSRVGLPSVRTT